MNLEDFEDFKTVEPMSPPPILSDRIFARVQNDLNPSPWKVFAKLSIIHFLSALVTLSICPQFGVRALGEGMGLMHYFMSLGTYGCMVACGSFFLGSTVLVAMLLLRPEEVRVIRSHRLSELGTLTGLSMGFFLMLEVEFVLGFFLAWALGSFAGGVLTLEAGWSIRQKLSS